MDSAADASATDTDSGIATISDTGTTDTLTGDGDGDPGDGDGDPCATPCGDACCEDGEVCNQDSMTCELDCGAEEPCGIDPPVCCGGGEICYVGQCVVPGGPCELGCATQTESDCDDDEICDPDLGQCVPDLADETCTYAPEPGVFDPVPRWSWGVRKPRACNVDDDCQKAEVCQAGNCEVTWPHHEPEMDDWPTHHQAMASPMVADLDGDCIPEVVFNSYEPATWTNNGILRAVHGDTGEKVWSLGDPAWRSDGTAIPAIGDIDYDGDLEIVNVGGDGRLHLIDHQGNPIWATANPVTPNQVSGAPALANFDLVGDAEIGYGRSLYGSDGTLLWTGTGGYGTNSAYATLSCVADLDGDLRPELIGGGTANASGATSPIAANDSVTADRRPIFDSAAAKKTMARPSPQAAALPATVMVRDGDGQVSASRDRVPTVGSRGPSAWSGRRRRTARSPRRDHASRAPPRVHRTVRTARG